MTLSATVIKHALPTLTKAQFNKLPAAKRRVLLAEDVIRYIAVGGINIEWGTYLEAGERVDDEGMQDAYKASTSTEAGRACLLNEGCHVCAKGALFVASVLRTNKCTVENVLFNSGPAEMRDRMLAKERIFSARTYDLIEIAFEGNVTGEVSELAEWKFSDEEKTAALIFCDRYENHSSGILLAAIMLNIISNNGEFVLTKPPSIAAVTAAIKAAMPKSAKKRPAQK